MLAKILITLYIFKQQNMKLSWKKKAKLSLSYKSYAICYSVDIFNFLNLELQLADAEPAIKNKPVD